MAPVVLLGPQRYRPTLAEAFRYVNAEGPVAAVTAGWEEREDEIDDLSEQLGHEVVNLRLHGRTANLITVNRERQSAFISEKCGAGRLFDRAPALLRMVWVGGFAAEHH